MTSAGQVWIPSEAGELQQRLCVVAHAGASGHRGAATTLKSLESCFFWSTMGPDVTTFVSECLDCMVTAGGRIPRPFGETLRDAPQRGVALRFPHYDREHEWLQVRVGPQGWNERVR